MSRVALITRPTTKIAKFPRFTVLDMEHIDIYNDIVKKWPAVSDISFATLMIWWTHSGSLYVSVDGKNLIIDYRTPSAPEDSGWSVIGTDEVEKTIAKVFEYQKNHNLKQKIIHVPEFVIDKITYSDYIINEELHYNEYIFDAAALSTLENSQFARTRWKVNKFHKEAGGKVEVKDIDISQADIKRELLNRHLEWREKFGTLNDDSNDETRALSKALSSSDLLGFHALGLYINDELHGYAVYRKTHDDLYLIVNHVKYQKKVPRTFDALTHEIAKKAMSMGIEKLNYEMDLGIEGLRTHKMGLRPISFFRKFSMEPKG